MFHYFRTYRRICSDDDRPLIGTGALWEFVRRPFGAPRCFSSAGGKSPSLFKYAQLKVSQEPRYADITLDIG